MATNALFDHMRGEHRQLVARIDALAGRLAEERGPGMPLPADVLDETLAVGRALSRHFEVEDEEIYDAVKRLVPETAPHLAALRTQRAELRAMLDALLERLSAPDTDDDRDEQIVVESEDLFELVRIHVRKEEALVFGLAEGALRAVPTPNAKGLPS